MTKAITTRTLLDKHVSKRDRVLLLNPPVFETRYSWLRWNQPLDLLQIGSHLKTKVKCGVDLFDFMLPDAKGMVEKQGLTGMNKHRCVGDAAYAYTYPMWRFGKSFSTFDKWLTAKQTAAKASKPTQVWITSLCSYWFRSIHQTCTFVRSRLPDAQIVLLGNYPRLMPDHASESSDADLIITNSFENPHLSVSLSLYDDARPPFASLSLRAETTVTAIRHAVQDGVHHFAFFDDDICRDNGEPLREVVEKTKGLHPHLRFHAIAGLRPERLTPQLAAMLADRSFAELHFEEAAAGPTLDEDAYRRARSYLVEAGTNVGDGDKTSGFVWIGRPGDTLEEIVRRCFFVLGSFGSVILKPFTPVPGTDVFTKHNAYLKSIAPEDLSPHMFPFAEHNKITREEYHDLYRMAAFLNEKVRNRSFDFVNGSMGAGLLRNSLRREAWKLEASPLSVAD
jgi:hypothetical protein